MTHASLFSGIGGFDLSAQWAGFENLFNCEIDPFCQKALKYHFPNATQFSDIKTTDFTPWRGKVDILTGGFPCQPFSLAGRRKGTDDDRYLWPEMLRAIREISPRWVVGENVLGIINWSQGLVLEQVCTDLEAEGYEVQPYLLPACGVNAPHQRYRVWFVAHTQSNRDNRRTRPMCCKKRGSDSQLPTQLIQRSGLWPIANTDDKRFEQQSRNTLADQSRQFSRDTAPCGFDAFPTQSPVCRGDDGLSDWLDIEAVYVGLGAKRRRTARPYPRWRQAAIKGFGNAVVPQVPFQIMEAIKDVELKQDNNENQTTQATTKGGGRRIPLLDDFRI